MASDLAELGLPGNLLEHPGLEQKQHTGGVDLVPTQIVIGEAIARVRLVDDLDHAIDRIHLGAGNVDALRRNDGGQLIDREC